MFPVEARLAEIRRALESGRDVVLTAPPGSGKTTVVPAALIDEPWLQGRKIVMLEPRRLAARNCATYIAARRGEAVGGTVGYQVRLERKLSRSTRLEIVTEGLLTSRIMDDPELAEVGLVVFDEFHERSLTGDLAYALALDVKRSLRPDLRVLVMSATLDVEATVARLAELAVAQGLPPPAGIEASGRMFPVDTCYLGGVSLAAAVSRALAETTGDILAFLPGEGEIRRALETVGPTLAGKAVGLPLYGALAKEEQDRVFQPGGPRKVVFATSIAETSLTLPGITAVIDSGLMRVPRFSPATGMTGLVTLPLTQDRAEQRRGRTGRVQAGVCYRLWTEAEDASRPRKMMPEILDADLSSLVLTCFAWGACRREDLPWMTMPPASSWEQAVGLLKLLGALTADGRLTDRGRAMAHLPMHPRLGNLLAGVGRSSDDRPALLAAIIEEGGRSRETDVRKVMDEIRETPKRPFSARILRLARQFAGSGVRAVEPGASEAVSEGALLMRAYPDRVAKNRGNGTFCMVSGRGVKVEPTDPLAKAAYLVACTVDDRAGDARLFLGCPVDEQEILAQFGDQVVEAPYCAWDRPTERVKAVIRRQLGAMTLGEVAVHDFGEGARIGSELVAAALVDGVRQKGVENLPGWTRESRQLRDRINFLARKLPAEAHWQSASDAALLAALPGFVSGLTKWKDLERVDMAKVLEAVMAVDGHDRRELDRLAPVRMEVPSGSHLLIHYDGDEPTVEVRLQECFGLMATPKVADGRVPIVMTLLSPAQRPIQITKDLAGFWKGAYQLVRKDMRGRYPKHYWPEDPLTAVATRRTIRPQT